MLRPLSAGRYLTNDGPKLSLISCQPNTAHSAGGGKKRSDPFIGEHRWCGRKTGRRISSEKGTTDPWGRPKKKRKELLEKKTRECGEPERKEVEFQKLGISSIWSIRALRLPKKKGTVARQFNKIESGNRAVWD